MDTPDGIAASSSTTPSKKLQSPIWGIGKHTKPSIPRHRHEGHRWYGNGAEADLSVRAPLPLSQRRSTTCKTKP
jgi:hypothetical protein